MQKFNSLGDALAHVAAVLGESSRGGHTVEFQLLNLELTNSIIPQNCSVEYYDLEGEDDPEVLPTCTIQAAFWSIGDLGYGDLLVDRDWIEAERSKELWVTMSVGGSTLASAGTLALHLTWE